MSRVLWVGDACVQTGFARCTHAACLELSVRGWDVHVLGINYYGDPHPLPFKVYPCYNPTDGGRDIYGVSRLPRMLDRLKPDLLVLLNDPWNLPGYMRTAAMAEYQDYRTVAYLAVDGENHQGSDFEDIHHAITWTEFAKNEIRRAGFEGPIDVVPLGVDTSVFYSESRVAAREAILPMVPEDRFLIGRIDRNQLRKRWDLTLEYFSEFAKTHEEAILYAHCAPTGESGFDIRALARYYMGTRERHRILYANLPVNGGPPDPTMRTLYSSLDAYLTTTQGEGWGLPVLEAMACGVPCVVPDWSGLGSWAHAAQLVPCTGRAPTAPVGSALYTMGGIPDREGTLAALEKVYQNWVDPKRACEDIVGGVEEGLILADQLSWRNNAVMVADCLDSVLAATTPKPQKVAEAV